jgi:ATP synthase protein I
MPREKPDANSGGLLRQLGLAMELPFVVLGGVAVGGAAGYLLDGWLHTRPWLMLALGALGFAAGMRDLLRRLNREEQQDEKDDGK